eukprot:gene12486-12620_t
MLEADLAAADVFAAARQQRLLSHCVAGWTAAVVVGGSARSAAVQLLQAVWQQQLLQDWKEVAAACQQIRSGTFTAWREATVEAKVRRYKEEAAEKLHSLQLQKRAFKAWLVVRCRVAGAREIARKLAARQAAAALTAFAANARRQQYKRLLLQQAEDFRKIRLLLLCVRWWRAWARYRGVLDQVEQGLGYQAQVERKLAAAAGCRDRRLVRAALQEWWLATAGSKMVLQFQVSTLVRLVGACFKLWRGLAVAEAHNRRRLKCAALGSWWQLTCERHIEELKDKAFPALKIARTVSTERDRTIF